jgi:Flp pilus assembly protein TadG
MLSRLRCFRRDDRGVSALEFALIAPVMILIYVSMVELCQGLLAERRASHATAAVGDLITQDQSVTTDELQDIFSIGNSIMMPMSAATLKMCVASIKADDVTGALTVVWSQNSPNGAPTGGCKSVPASFPTDATTGKPIIGAGDSVVLSRAEYTYSTMFTKSKLFSGPIVFKEVFFLRPRKSTTVACTVGSTTTNCIPS